MSVVVKPSSANLGVTEEFGQSGERLGDREMITHAITNTSIHLFNAAPRGKRIYLLDRCVIGLIKKINSGKAVTRDIDIYMANRLKSLDRWRNTFSIILSITEGQIGEIQSNEDFISVIHKESSVLKKFFIRARTDGDIWISQIDSLRALCVVLRESKLDSYLDFVRWVSPQICEPISAAQRRKKMIEILDEVSKLEIPPQHPIVISCLGVLYGSEVARGVLKPNKKASKAHNAVSDLMTLSRISQYLAVDAEAMRQNPQSDKGIDFTFLTLDANLRQLYDLIEIGRSSVSHDSDRDVSVTTGELHVRRELFPEISDEDFDYLSNTLSDQTRD